MVSVPNQSRGASSLAVDPLIIKPFFQAELVQVILDSRWIFVGSGAEVDSVDWNIERVTRPPKIDAEGLAKESFFASRIDVHLVRVGQSTDIDREKVQRGIDIGPGCDPPPGTRSRAAMASTAGARI